MYMHSFYKNLFNIYSNIVWSKKNFIAALNLLNIVSDDKDILFNHSNIYLTHVELVWNVKSYKAKKSVRCNLCKIY